MVRHLWIVCIIVATCSCGRPDALSEGPRPRVVSLLPNATEILFAIGAGDNVVAATRYCTRPDAARALKRVGGILDVSVEAVLSVQPDLVIGSPTVLGGRVGEALSAIGARLLPLEFETIGSIESGVLAIGEALGRTEEASRLAAQIHCELMRLEGRGKRVPPVRVLVVVGRSPLVVAARGSFIGDLLERAGIENVAGSSFVPFPTWTLEQVLRSDPEVVVDAAVEALELDSLLSAAGLQAARAGRILRLADDALLRPGPSTPAAALALVDRVMEMVR